MQRLLEFWGPHIERCGLILKNGAILELPNVHEDPQNGFRVDPAEILKHEAETAATWHTHPSGNANLSMEDYHCFLAWPELFHYVVSRVKVNCYFTEFNRVYLHDDSDLPRLPQGAVPQRSPDN